MASIIFRADGNSKNGLGHLIRSSALAEMLKENYHCILATRCRFESLLKEMHSVFAEIISLPEVDYPQEARRFHEISTNENLVILDGYYFDDAYQLELFQKGFDIFSIDDIHAFPFFSKAIINHSGGLTPLHYRSIPYTQFYLGPTYALLRRPFLDAAKSRKNGITDSNCFICFGGADPGNQTMQILLDANIRKHFKKIHVVIGNAYKYRAELEAFVKDQSEITVHYALSSLNMAAVMKECSYAICSPSTIVYEYLSVGGIVFLQQTADNQKNVISYFVNEGMAFPLVQLGKVDDSAIASSFTKQKIYFDGKQDQRLRKCFDQYFESKLLTIRKATEQDIETCYYWVNDPEVRAQSYNQSPISLQVHTTWFHNKLKDAHNYYYILERQKKPVAQIRFQVSNNEAVLGYLAGKSIRSNGLGTAILAKGIEAFVKDYNKPIEITGYVKKTNLPSQRSFERLAFVKEEATTYPDSYKYTMHYGN